MTVGIARNIAAILLIAGVVVLCYENSLDGDFVFDDNPFIVNNNNIKGLSFEDFGRFRQSLEDIAGYNPFRCLLSFSFALHYRDVSRADKDDPSFVPDSRPFHITNVAIHLVNGLLVFFIVRTLLAWHRKRKKWGVPYVGGLAAALLFSSAAVGTEAVTYIVGRSNSMCAMFCLAATLAFLGAGKIQKSRYKGEDGTRRWTLAWTLLVIPLAVLVYKLLVGSGVNAAVGLLCAAALLGLWLGAMLYLFVFKSGRLQPAGDGLMLLMYVFFGLAALTKELAVVLPFLLLMLDSLVLSGGVRGYMKRRWKYHALMLGTIVLFVALHQAVVGSASKRQMSQLWEEGTKPDINYLTTQVSGPVMTGYLRQFFLPVALNIDNDVSLRTPEQAKPVFTIEFVVLFVILLIVIRLTRYARMFAAGVLWYFIALIPTSSILKFADTMDEGRIYLSIVGLCWAAAVAVTACFDAPKTGRRRAAVRVAGVILLAGIVALNCFHARRRNLDYRTAVGLWHDTVLKSPLKARVHNGLGYELLGLGSHQEGIVYHCETAVKLRAEVKKLRFEVPRKDKIIKRNEELFAGRISEMKRLCEIQRRYLAATKTMFQTSITLYEGGTWKRLQEKSGTPEWIPTIISIFQKLQSQKAFTNLAVAYSADSVALDKSRELAGELNLDEKATTAQMQACRYSALKLYEQIVSLHPEPNVLTNGAMMHYEMAKYYYAKRDFDIYERYALRAERLAAFALRINKNFYVARNLLCGIAGHLAQYYVKRYREGGQREHLEKARHYLDIVIKMEMRPDRKKAAEAELNNLDSGLHP